MLTKKRLMALLFCLTFNIIYSLPAFTSLPTLRQIDSLSYVNFTLSEFTDVEVTIVDTIQKKVIRHLGAGMLGDNAPVPFSKNTLTQSVEWNGRDDNGVTVQDLSGIMARVRAGMRPRYDAMADKLIEKGVKKSNNYWFGASNFETENFFGLSVDSTGTLYVLGTSSVGNTIALRAYDGESGAYRNTIMPFPSGLDRNTLVPYEIMFLDEDNYRYKTSTLADLMYRAGPLNAERFSGYLLPEVVGGDFLAFIYSRMNNVGQFKRTFNTTVHLGLNSVITPSGALIKSPTLASLYSGPLYLTLSKDRKSIFMSGIYSWISTGGNSGWGTGYVDTLSFWRDGQVYKIDIATGVASPFISIPKDSLLASKRAEFQGRGPDASINGVAVDDSGRVFICDRVHNQIGVYDSVGHFIKAILQANADNIAVNKNTGELYVIVRGIGIPTVLKKFSDWRGSNPSVVSNYSFSASVKSYLAVSYKGEKPVVWLSGNQGYGYNNQGIWGVRDDGSQLTLVSSFNDSGYTGGAQYRDAWSGYITRMDADPTTNQVIATNNFHGLFKVEDWSNPIMAICSTTSNKRLTASEVQVGADGFLYTQTGYQVSRYTLNHLHSPVNYLEKNNNILADSISNDMYIQGAAFAGIGTKGFAVSRNGNMAFQDRHGIALYDTTGKLLKDLIVSPMLITAAALRFDPAGFLYVGGGRCYPTSMNTPVNYSSETSYLNATGVIAKFDVTSVNKGGFTSSQVNNALTVYTNAGIGPYSADPGNSCICRSPRFDIDAFGRLFVPNGISGKVRVVDNTNNLLMEFGDYGNADSKGSDSYIPLFMPMTAAATDDYIYVSDDVNVRLIRVKIDYVLDNIPTFLGTLSVNRLGTKLEKKHAYILTATPNPFNPICAISVDMSTNHYVTQQNAEHITLAIYSADGRLIRILADGLNQTGKFIWDGRDMRNQIATAGLYVVRFSAGQQITSKKIVLAK